jgi:hypothetical protein
MTMHVNLSPETLNDITEIAIGAMRSHQPMDPEVLP